MSKAKDILFGVAVGDALGVPVEFKSREEIRHNPVRDMMGYGTHNLPPGTWSDDSSLTFCLAEALLEGYSLERIAHNFVKWWTGNYWTPLGSVFDIGIATQKAIVRLQKGTQPELAGGFEARDNGNGSLMRILPLLLYIKDYPIEERYRITKQVSSLTHGHIRSVISCFYYLEFAKLLVETGDKWKSYKELQSLLRPFFESLAINHEEIQHFTRLLQGDISILTEEDIESSGYVVHTLEASIWSLLTTNSYSEAVLRAVNLGDDTDTTGAVTGGLAGLLYGVQSIPGHWVVQLARKYDIDVLAKALFEKYRIDING